MPKFRRSGNKTTPALRIALQKATESAATLAERYGINPKTVLKWRHRGSVEDRPKGPRTRRSTVLSAFEEAAVVAFRCHTRLALDDALRAITPHLPQLTRSSLHRLFQRHAINRLPSANPTAGDLAPGERLWAEVYPVRLDGSACQVTIGFDRLTRQILVSVEQGSLEDALAGALKAFLAEMPGRLASIAVRCLDDAAHPAGREPARLPAIDRICRSAGVGLRLLPVDQPWGDEPRPSTRRTIAEEVERRFGDLPPERLRDALVALASAYNRDCRLAVLGGAAPEEYAAGLARPARAATGQRQPPGKRSRAVTINDIARRVGVSAMTVSRVINADPDVKASTREKVSRAVRALNYRPNTSARRLVGAKVVHIGLLYGNPSSAYLGELLSGAIQEAGRGGHSLVLEKCDETGDEVAAVRRLLARGVDGIIVPPPLSDMAPVQQEIGRAGIASVAFGDAAGGNPIAVGIDDTLAARDMTRYLLSLGHREIAFIKGHPNQRASRLRYLGFLAALQEAGLSCPGRWIGQGYFSYVSGIAAARDILADSPYPTAIFASNDDMAAAAVSVVHQRGMSVPGDISVAGFDDTVAAMMACPALTTVRQPIALMAERAVSLLAGAVLNDPLADDAGGRHELLSYTIITRDSCRRPV